MADYGFSVGGHLTGPQYPLEVINPQLTFNLTGEPHQAQITIDARSEGGRALLLGAQDLFVLRDGVPLPFRGPVTARKDDGQKDRHQVTVTCSSYRYRLGKRYTNLLSDGGDQADDDYTLPAGNAPAVAWDLIAAHLGGADLASLIVDASDTGSPLSTAGRAIKCGVPIATAVDTIASSSDAAKFDWDLVPNPTTGKIEFTTWSPQRGTAKPDRIIQYDEDEGGNCEFSRDQDIVDYGNSAYVKGSYTDSSGNRTRIFQAASSVPAGSIGDYTVIDSLDNLQYASLAAAQAAVKTRADDLLAEAQALTPSYQVTMDNGWWKGPGDVWLGDSPTVAINSGGLAVNESMRVSQIVLQDLTDGAEKPVLTLGARPKTTPEALVRNLAAMHLHIIQILLNQ